MSISMVRFPIAFVLSLLLMTSAVLAGSIIVLPDSQTPGAQDRLAREIAYYGDYGSLAVGEGDAAAVARLAALGFEVHSLGEWPQTGALYVSDPEHVPATARVLYRTATQRLYHSNDEEPLPGCMHRRALVQRIAWKVSPGFPRPRSDAGKSVNADPQIAALVSQVNKSNLQATVTHLASYQTRRSDQAVAHQAKDWLVQQFQAIPGLSVSTDTFNASYTPNIIATYAGATHPERLVVLGAHYDSIAGGALAPGADDNASGSAGILEVARLLPQLQYENTVRLVLFSAEEFGLIGSAADAADLANAGADVVAMLNMDMNAYRAAGDTLDLDLVTNNTDPNLNQFLIDVTSAYLPGLPVNTGSLGGGTSDHQSYQTRGFPSAFFFEDLGSYSPYIHSSSDTVGLSANDFDLAQAIVRSFLAGAATLAAPLRMEISHTPLGDTTMVGSAYPLAATVTSLTAATVASVEAVYRVNGGGDNSRALIAAANAGEWIGSLPAVSPSGSVEYYLLATDSNGGQKWAPEGLNPGDGRYRFTAGQLTTIFADDFEAAGENGWTSTQVATQNDWQKGTPQGKGGYDPGSAASGTGARGNDLGIGNYNGNYAANVNNYLQSPAIDCSGHTGVRMRFNRWLTVEDGYYDRATVKINGVAVWSNPSTPGGGANHTIDTAWTPQELDISALADNHPAVRVRYQMQSDGGLEFGGWTLDDVELYTLQDGITPALSTSETAISAGQGSSVQFDIDAGPAGAGRPYVLAIGISGTTPPTVLNGVSIPLVFDGLTTLGFQAANTPAFQNFFSTLSPAGQATATMVLPPTALPNVPGVTLSLAAFTVQPVTWASNPVNIVFGN